MIRVYLLIGILVGFQSAIVKLREGYCFGQHGDIKWCKHNIITDSLYSSVFWPFEISQSLMFWINGK